MPSFFKMSKLLFASGSRHIGQVELFARREAPVLLLNASHYGAGLNLEAASHVVLMHRMDADLETQVVGRAQRLGRTAPLRVVRLVHPGE